MQSLSEIYFGVSKSPSHPETMTCPAPAGRPVQSMAGRLVPLHQSGGQRHGWVGLVDMRGAWLVLWSRLAPPTQRRSSGSQDGRASRCECWRPGVAGGQRLGR